ncbi:hypothetical protein L873DRAFT_394918 [Choiromyces venosus 120613-1]|uniref:Uncharacterized protein n=1 Tax=Choiromyces venosus 120613-1 TaxID=1336337 RepID=A0A3N4IXW8_9PEZI|nr:hypothetical protein L873DRAFT_394918 [Choiromyces venosus 120613-1]
MGIASSFCAVLCSVVGVRLRVWGVVWNDKLQKKKKSLKYRGSGFAGASLALVCSEGLGDYTLFYFLFSSASSRGFSFSFFTFFLCFLFSWFGIGFLNLFSLLFRFTYPLLFFFFFFYWYDFFTSMFSRRVIILLSLPFPSIFYFICLRVW